MIIGMNVKCETASGATVDKLCELIRKRSEYLKGELTEQSVTATALNIVKSLRAATRVASTRKSGKKLDAAYCFRKSTFVGGVYSESANGSPLTKNGTPRKAARHFCIRDAGGHRTDLVKPAFADNPATTPLVGAPVYYVFVKHTLPPKNLVLRAMQGGGLSTAKTAEGVLRYAVIAKDEESLRGWARRHVRDIIAQESGMARYALSILRKSIYAKGKGDALAVKSAGAKDTAARSVFYREAFGPGWFDLEGQVNLAYSVSALKNGAASIDVAMKKAANSTAQIINRVGKLPFEERIHTPFPEVASRRGRKT
jgi:hypothetical protein